MTTMKESLFSKAADIVVKGAGYQSSDRPVDLICARSDESNELVLMRLVIIKKDLNKLSEKQPKYDINDLTLSDIFQFHKIIF